MARSRHIVRRLSGFAGLILLGAAPFVVYAAVRVTSHKQVAKWPGDVAVVASSGTTLRQLSLLHVRASDAVLVQFPIDATLDAPDAGVLRGATIFRLGGPQLTASALSQSTGIEVRFWAQWKDGVTTSRGPANDNLGSNSAQFLALLRRAQPLTNPPGQWVTRDGIHSFDLDRDALRSQLGLAGAAPAAVQATPTPTPTPASTGEADPTISIEVMNRGGSPANVSKAVSLLLGAGYTDVSTTTSPRAPVNGAVVYFVRDRSDGEQVAAFLGIPTTLVKHITAPYTTNAQVLVVIGRI